MIIDLDKDFNEPPKKIEVISISRGKPAEKKTKAVNLEISSPKKETQAPREEISDEVRRDFLIEQIELEERDVRYQRAMAHRKYRKLLDHKLEPKGSDADFLEIYEEIEGYTEQLKQIWMRREHLVRFGTEQKSRIIDDATLAKIDALKYDRSRVSDQLYKAKKQLAIAKASGNAKKEANASAKIDQLMFRVLEIQTALKKLENE